MDYSTILIEQFRKGDKLLIVSDLTLLELQKAPRQVLETYDSIPSQFIDFMVVDDEAKFLAKKYIDEKAISEGSLVDAQHIAAASINRDDVLVSWNFKHIVNLHRIHGYNSVNLRRGYPTLEIRAPLEVLPDE